MGPKARECSAPPRPGPTAQRGSFGFRLSGLPDSARGSRSGVARRARVILRTRLPPFHARPRALYLCCSRSHPREACHLPRTPTGSQPARGAQRPTRGRRTPLQRCGVAAQVPCSVLRVLRTAKAKTAPPIHIRIRSPGLIRPSRDPDAHQGGECRDDASCHRGGIGSHSGVTRISRIASRQHLCFAGCGYFYASTK